MFWQLCVWSTHWKHRCRSGMHGAGHRFWAPVRFKGSPFLHTDIVFFACIQIAQLWFHLCRFFHSFINNCVSVGWTIFGGGISFSVTHFIPIHRSMNLNFVEPNWVRVLTRFCVFRHELCGFWASSAFGDACCVLLESPYFGRVPQENLCGGAMWVCPFLPVEPSAPRAWNCYLS